MIIKLRAFIQRYYVKRKRERPVELADFGDESADNDEQISHDIDYANSQIFSDYIYSKISTRQRQIIDLTLQGYKQQEIGKLLDISQSRVSVIKKRTLVKLQKLIQEANDLQDENDNSNIHLVERAIIAKLDKRSSLNKTNKKEAASKNNNTIQNQAKINSVEKEILKEDITNTSNDMMSSSQNLNSNNTFKQLERLINNSEDNIESILQSEDDENDLIVINGFTVSKQKLKEKMNQLAKSKNNSSSEAKIEAEKNNELEIKKKNIAAEIRNNINYNLSNVIHPTTNNKLNINISEKINNVFNERTVKKYKQRIDF